LSIWGKCARSVGVGFRFFDWWYQKSVSRCFAPGSNECRSLSHCARFVFLSHAIGKTDYNFCRAQRIPSARFGPLLLRCHRHVTSPLDKISPRLGRVPVGSHMTLSACWPAEVSIFSSVFCYLSPLFLRVPSSSLLSLSVIARPWWPPSCCRSCHCPRSRSRSRSCTRPRRCSRCSRCRSEASAASSISAPHSAFPARAKAGHNSSCVNTSKVRKQRKGGCRTRRGSGAGAELRGIRKECSDGADGICMFLLFKS